MSLDIPIHLLQSALENGNAPFTVTVLVTLPLLIVLWRAPELALRYFAAAATLLLPEKARRHFQETFQALADSERTSREDSDAGSQ